MTPPPWRRRAGGLAVAHQRGARTDSTGLPNNGMLIVVDPNGPPECRDGCFGRDYQARQIYDFYAAWEILGDPTYLRWAEEAADAMRVHIARIAHRGFTLFAWNIDRNLGEHDLPGWQSAIDSNQNAEIGLAFTLLATDPQSIYHTDAARRALALDIATNEIAASLTQQHGDPTSPDDGAIALSEHHPGRFDTAYGSYASWSWAWASRRNPQPTWETAVAAAGQWLATYPRAGQWGHYFQAPDYTTAIERLSSAEEVWHRIPALVAAGECDMTPLVDEMLGQEWSRQDPVGMWDNGSMLTAQLQLMAIPESVYLSGDCP